MNRILSFSLIVIALLLFPPQAGSQAPANVNPLEAEMVLVPPGNFLFGTNAQDEEGEALSLGIPKPWYIDEGPQQKIFLKSFYIDRFEVTNQRYKTFVDAVGAVPPPDWKGKDYPEGKDDMPVVWVNWFDAANFCDWAGKRLPTEKEWEKAARGELGNEYPWGNEFRADYANLPPKQGSKNAPVKVGSFPQGATPLGVQDLAGNVWEWTSDNYAPYRGSSYKTPDYEAGYKVIRGGSASDVGHFPGPSYLAVLKKFARSGFRQFLNPDEASLDLGFRCASDEMPEAMKKMASASPSFAAGGNAAPAQARGGISRGDTPPEKPAPASQVKTFNPFEPKPNLPQSGMLVLILLSFLAGLFSFMSPCTLPILPAYFAITAQTERTRMALMSMAFFCGLATLFVLMGASASFMGQLLRDYLFSLTAAGGVLVAGFGVMTLFGKGFSGASFRQKPASTFTGFFLFGATFALGWTPCVGPVLSGILILAASDKTVLQGMALLFFYAVGLGSPLIVIAAFFGHLKKDGLFWTVLRGKGWDVKIGNRTLLLHTTNLFSGALLVFLGVALAMGYMTYINNLIPIEIQVWFSAYEEKI
ncbi:MAG: SUMF1/EgtB/PvdO family nonheme iron enzyme, partial [Nitrospinae bacterium]|nr:SUMF1/EgtB/PvdO family nonheme iron enzyme [Nitrospinota bacterium]